MAFIRRRRVNRTDYYSVVESVREGRKVYQRTLASLGQCPSIEAAIERERKILAYWEHFAEHGHSVNRNGRYLYMDEKTGEMMFIPIGRPAELKAEQSRKKIALFQSCLDLVELKNGHRSVHGFSSTKWQAPTFTVEAA